MVDEELKDQYFDWIQDIVYFNAPFKNVSYRLLLNHLHRTKFVYILSRDANRYDDGLSLRNRFAYLTELPLYLSTELLESGDCSVLEMMVALAIREEDDMGDPYLGDRTAYWFWEMVQSLGLMNMSDRSYDEDEVDYILNRFMNRQYKPTGEGGLFTINDCDEDLRDVEIWYQMNWHLCECM